MVDCDNLTNSLNEQFVNKKNASMIFYESYTLIFGGFDGSKYNNDLVKFNINTKKFEKVACNQTPPPRSQHAACVANGKMYIFGGMNDLSTFDDLWEFDLKTCKFTQIVYEYGRYKTSALYGHAMAQLSNNELLIFGGSRDNNKLETLYYIYNIDTRQMQQYMNSDGPAPAIGCTLTFCNNQVYLFGGAGLKGFNQELWSMGQNRRWQQIRIQKNQPIARSYHQMTAFGSDRILLYGGENGKQVNQKLNDMWVLIPSQLTWVKLGEQKCQARSSHQQVIWKSKSGNFRVLILGGMGRSGFCCDLQQILLSKQYSEDIVENEQNLIQSVYQPNTDNMELDELKSNQKQVMNNNIQQQQLIQVQSKKIQDVLALSKSVHEQKVFQQYGAEIANNKLQLLEKEIQQLIGQKIDVQVLNAQISQLQEQLSNVNLQLLNVQNMGGQKDRTQINNNNYSFQQLNDVKVELTQTLTKNFNQNLMQTQQELIALSKKLVGDQNTQLQADMQMLTNNINCVNSKINEYMTHNEQQFVKESQIAHFSPKLEFLESIMKQYQQQIQRLNNFTDQQDTINSQIMNQIDDCSYLKSLKAGVEQIVDNRMLNIKNQINKLENLLLRLDNQQLSSLNQNNINETTQNQTSINSKHCVNVLNITDEVFQQKLLESLEQMKQQNNQVFVDQQQVEQIFNKQFSMFKEIELQNLKQDIIGLRNQQQNQPVLELIQQINNQLVSIQNQLPAYEQNDQKVKQIIIQQQEIKNQFTTYQTQIRLLNDEIMSIRSEQTQQKAAVQVITRSQLIQSNSATCETPLKKSVRFAENQQQNQPLQINTIHESDKQQEQQFQEYLNSTKSSVTDTTRLQQSLHNTVVNKQHVVFNTQNVQQGRYVQRLFFDQDTITQHKVTSLSADFNNNQVACIDQNYIKIFDISEKQSDITQAFDIMQLQSNEIPNYINLLNGKVFQGLPNGSLKMIINSEFFEFAAFNNQVTSIFAFDSQHVSYLLAGSQQGQIGLWEPERTNYSIIGDCYKQVNFLQLQNENCIAGDCSGKISFYDLVMQQQVFAINPSNNAEITALHCYQNMLSVADSLGNVKLYDNRVLKQFMQIKDHNVRKLWNNDQLIIAACQDSSISIYDIRNTQTVLQQIKFSDSGETTDMCVLGSVVCVNPEAGCVTGLDFD